MKLGIMTDIHGNLEALKAVLLDLKNEQCDELISLGDAIAIGPCPKETLDVLIKNNVTMMMGNHEQYYLMPLERLELMVKSPSELTHQKWVREVLGDAYKEKLNKLPYHITRQYGQTTCHMMHYPIKDNWFVPFVPEPTLESLKEMFGGSKNEVFFYGHHHPKREDYDEENNIRYINPGSLGCTKLPETYYVIIKLSEDGYEVKHKVIPYNRDVTLNKLDLKEVPARTIIKSIFFGEEVMV